MRKKEMLKSELQHARSDARGMSTDGQQRDSPIQENGENVGLAGKRVTTPSVPYSQESHGELFYDLDTPNVL
jgi:hypothetical protein